MTEAADRTKSCARNALQSSLVLLGPQPRKAVGDVEAQLVRALDDLLALLRPDVVRDLDAVLLIVHQQHLQIRWALHEELVEAVLEAIAGLLIGAIPDRWEESRALELPADAAVNAARLAPSLVHALEAVRLEARELLHALLHNLALVRWRRHDSERPFRA